MMHFSAHTIYFAISQIDNLTLLQSRRVSSKYNVTLVSNEQMLISNVYDRLPFH